MGPSGGAPHRILDRADPDTLKQPFAAHYQSWFGKGIKNPSSYGINDVGGTQKRVCFKELYILPYPSVPFVWNEWRALSECAGLAPSPLYQSFNLFLRNHWARTHDLDDVTFSSDRVKILILTRSKSNGKEKLPEANIKATARIIKNFKSMQDELESIPNVQISVHDFSEVSFDKQLEVVRSSQVIVGMHGAALAHMFHMSIGSKFCCAVVELFPEKKFGYQDIHGYRNIALNLGVKYFRHEEKIGSAEDGGSVLDVNAVRQLVLLAVTAFTKSSSCLNDVKNNNLISSFNV